MTTPHVGRTPNTAFGLAMIGLASHPAIRKLVTLPGGVKSRPTRSYSRCEIRLLLAASGRGAGSDFFACGAAPRRGCARPRDIWRPCGERCRCRRCFKLLDDLVVGQDALAGSASISWRMRWRTASEECASPPSAEAIAEVKKYLSSNTPRGVAMYLLDGDAAHRRFVHRDGVGHGLQVERPQVSTP